MTQSPAQSNTANTFPGPNKPEIKTGAPQTDAEKKAQADKAQPEGSCSTKS